MKNRKPCPTSGHRAQASSIGRRSKAAIAAVILSAGAVRTEAANIVQTWGSAVDGTWTDTTKWSSGVVPNNGADTHSVTVGATGSPYTVTLAAPATVNDFTLNSANATLAITSGTFSVANSAINLANGTMLISNGTLANSSINFAGGTLVFGSGRFSNVGVNGSLNISTTGAILGVNGATFGGAVNITGNSSKLAFFGTQTITPTTYNIDGPNAYLSLEGPVGTLTIPSGATVRGGNGGGIWYGFITGGGGNGLINNGTIQADIAGAAFNIFPSGAHTFTNNGTLIATNGATLNVSAFNWSMGPGAAIKTSGTSVMNLDGAFSGTNLLSNVTRAGGTINIAGTINNTGNHLQFTATTGDWFMNGGTINGGSITTSGGSLRFTNTGNRFNNVSFNGALNLDIIGARVGISGTSAVNGTINLSANSTKVGFFDTVTAPATTYNLDGSGVYLSTEGTGTMTLPAGAVVRGGNGGGIWYGFFSGGSANTVVNNGLIQSDLTGTSFTIFPSGNNTFTNNGTCSAINGSTLTISASTWSNTGHINASNSTLVFANNWSSTGSISITNSALFLGGTFSTSSLSALNRSGGTVLLSGQWNNLGSGFTFNATTGDWTMNGGTINGGSITTSGAAPRFTPNGVRFNNVAYNGTLNLNLNNGSVGMSGVCTVSGPANLTGTNTSISFLDTMTAPVTTYNLDGLSSYLYTTGTGSLTIAAGTTIRGGNNGGIWYGFVGGINNTVINNGTIQADVNNGTFTVFPSGNTTFINNGTLIATNGARLIVNRLSGNLNRVRIDGPGHLVRLNGTYNINQPIAVPTKSTLNFQGVSTLNADIDASGRIIFDYTPPAGSPLNDIRNRIISGRNGGLWNGPGINSTAAASTPGTAAGYGESSAALGPAGGTFSGESVDGSAVLVRWTYAGDSDLDGDVDVADLGKLATNWQTANVWTGGDFDYSGFVDVADLGLLATNWQAGVGNPLGPSLQEALTSVGLSAVAIPEPTGTAMLLAHCILLLRRRLESRRA